MKNKTTIPKTKRKIISRRISKMSTLARIRKRRKMVKKQKILITIVVKILKSPKEKKKAKTKIKRKRIINGKIGRIKTKIRKRDKM